MGSSIMWRNKYAYLIFLLTGISGCISEIDLTHKGSSTLYISGVISNSSGERTLRVRQTQGLDTLAIPVQASAVLIENDKVVGNFNPIEKGFLALPEDIPILPGRTYEVEVGLQDGRTFRTLPQTVKRAAGPDSLSFEISPVNSRNSDGTTDFAWMVQLFAHITVTEQNKDSIYYRWQVDNSWAFKDWRDTLCYLGETIFDFEPVIFHPEGLQPGEQKVLVASRELGSNFLISYYYNTYLHRVDSLAYDYYSKAQTLTKNDGVIYDEIPAPIQGNVYEVSDNKADQPIAGYVEFSLADTTRLRINRTDFTFQMEDPCERYECNPELPVCLCEDCGEYFEYVRGVDTEIPPVYWE
ncbi:MAG: hypothetical protein AAGA10_25735 [Bacteroidota bacterium]